MDLEARPQQMPGGPDRGSVARQREAVGVREGTVGHREGHTEEWARVRCDDLAQGRFVKLLVALRLHSEECEVFRLARSYFEANRDRMSYYKVRKRGLCVGSGVVEAGWTEASKRDCPETARSRTFLLVPPRSFLQRLSENSVRRSCGNAASDPRCTGRWTETNPILALRCSILSGHYEDC